MNSIACYVGGRGMFATTTTRDFKVEVFKILERTGLGYDTRHRFYREQYPEMSEDKYATMVCDPVEDYDKEWESYLKEYASQMSQEETLTKFFSERDAGFRREARAAIYCYDEAGFGSGVNTMRFLNERKPILGFYKAATNLNIGNIIQLCQEYPDLVSLVTYEDLGKIEEHLVPWLKDFRNV